MPTPLKNTISLSKSLKSQGLYLLQTPLKYRYILGLGYGVSFIVSFFRQYEEIESKPALNPVILTEYVLLTRHFDGVSNTDSAPNLHLKKNCTGTTLLTRILPSVGSFANDFVILIRIKCRSHLDTIFFQLPLQRSDTYLQYFCSFCPIPIKPC